MLAVCAPQNTCGLWAWRCICECCMCTPLGNACLLYTTFLPPSPCLHALYCHASPNTNKQWLNWVATTTHIISFSVSNPVFPSLSLCSPAGSTLFLSPCIHLSIWLPPLLTVLVSHPYSDLSPQQYCANTPQRWYWSEGERRRELRCDNTLSRPRWPLSTRFLFLSHSPRSLSLSHTHTHSLFLSFALDQ